MKIIAYRDLSVDNKHGYQIQTVESDSMIIEEMVFPEAQGFPPMYIRHIRFINSGEPILIISQTDYELDADKKIEIIAGAIEFLSA